MPSPGHLAGAVTALAAVFILRRIIRTENPRSRRVKQVEERILVLGASSGLGRTLAKQYAARGARICVVARRSEPLIELAQECGDRCLPFVADLTGPAEMEKLREYLIRQWGGLDTLHVCAGVSAVQPVMALTGIKSSDEDPDAAGIQLAAEIAADFGFACYIASFLGRGGRGQRLRGGLYAATKAASLLLYQSLAIEHPEIAFTCVLPATIEGKLPIFGC
ncbi:hypothetical protein NUW58_g3739 [Xylaria curta]|uniref:Uncharacterized protein n=1 Tax=Xylaria curta TaxID=42375 RepID=A0ACC1P9J0_9PEZI|nr:hypothetical protein NUW58_g3739 [Xylaria curta]